MAALRTIGASGGEGWAEAQDKKAKTKKARREMNVFSVWRQFKHERRIARIFSGKQPSFADIMVGETTEALTSNAILQSSRCDAAIPTGLDPGLIPRPIYARASQQLP